MFRRCLSSAAQRIVARSLGLRHGKLAALAGFGAATATITTAAASHCASSSKPVWTLQYFPIPGVPGEIVRLMLALGGEEWTDERVPGSKWAGLKPTTPYGKMPVLTSSDGAVLTQSRAIAHYFAKRIRVQGALLYPEDPWEAYKVDEFIEALEDVRGLISKTFAIKDQADKEAARAALFATDGSGAVFEGFKKIEALCPPGGKMVGGRVTLADAWLFVTVNQLRAGWMDGVPADGWMDKLPKLKAVVATVSAVPEVRKYYEANKAMTVMGKQVYLPHAGAK